MDTLLYPKYFIRKLFTKGRETFFSDGYKCLYPEYDRHGMTPWQHYVLKGRRKGYDDGNHPPATFFFPEGYLAEYPDVWASGENPWHHYVTKGKAAGRDNGLHPTEKQFFPEGYLKMYPDAAKSSIDPWRHYVLYGIPNGRDNGLHPGAQQFFPEGYLEMYPDAANADADPWHHYVLYGAAEGRDNGLHPDETFFSPEGYLVMYPDAEKSSVDPWHHYVLYGKPAGRTRKRAAGPVSYTEWVYDLNSNRKHFVDDDGVPFERTDADPKIFAYYLPQFHAIPLNDRNYGKGFTEWTNVARSTPLFLGHYQPRIPYDVGFYSLDHVETLERQAALARQYGIYGFCFYYYWFGGTKVLEKPLRLFLESDIDLKFHLMWANENWSKLWDGGNKELILEQKLELSMAEAFYKDLQPYIRDCRYEKIGNRPVLAVYRPSLFSENLFRAFLKRLDSLAKDDGFSGFYFLGTNGFSFREPEKYGLEGIIEFPPHDMWDIEQVRDVEWFNLKTSIRLLDMHKWIGNKSYLAESRYKVFKCCFPHWDSSPRKAYSGACAFIMQDGDFYSWLRGIISWTRKNHSTDEQYVYINAWNEWGEGAYLEPDTRYGYADLRNVRQALEDSRSD